MMTNGAASNEISSRRRRIISATKALLFGNLTSIALQLGSVPVFLAFWGVSVYGEWVILYAIPGYLAVSDFGVIAVATNKVDMLCQKSNFSEAGEVFANSLLLLGVFCFGTCLVLALAAWSASSTVDKLFPSTATVTVWKVAALLSMDSVLSILFNHLAGLFRSVRAYQLTLTWQNVARLGTGFGLISAVVLGADFVAAAGTLLGLRTLLLILLVAHLRVEIHWLKLEGMKVSLAGMGTLVRLSRTFLIFPVSNMLYLHVTTVILGLFTTPAVVASFSILRTYTRLIPQFVSIAGKAVWAENSWANSANDVDFVERSLKSVVIYSVVLSAASVLGFVIFGERVFEWWTGGRTLYDATLFAAMLSHAFFIALYTSMEVFILSTNTHSQYAFVFLALSVLQVTLAAALFPSLGPAAFPLFGTLAAAATFGYVMIMVYANLHRLRNH